MSCTVSGCSSAGLGVWAALVLGLWFWHPLNRTCFGMRVFLQGRVPDASVVSNLACWEENPLTPRPWNSKSTGSTVKAETMLAKTACGIFFAINAKNASFEERAQVKTKTLGEEPYRPRSLFYQKKLSFQAGCGFVSVLMVSLICIRLIYSLSQHRSRVIKQPSIFTT
ncbi:MAG: hypothetical protein H7834_05400 [Magnetococcus sp. YQC-9]